MLCRPGGGFFEYALIAGVNDSVEQARKLSRLLQGLFVPRESTSRLMLPLGAFNTAPRECVAAFRQVLEDGRVPVDGQSGSGSGYSGRLRQLRSRR